jgi:hypothetical protein
LNRRSEEAQGSIEDRCEGFSGNLESEKRSETGPQRSIERRVLRYALIFKTEIPYADLEAWLSANIPGKWTLVLKNTDIGLTFKTLRIMFGAEEDRDTCRTPSPINALDFTATSRQRSGVGRGW